MFNSVSEIPPHLLGGGLRNNPTSGTAPPLAPRTKHGNRRTFFADPTGPDVVEQVRGRWFDSQAEAKRYAQLLLRVQSGELLGVIPQISIPLPSGQHRMRLDFGLVGHDGRILLADQKGFVTDVWQLKHDEVTAAYGVKIEIFGRL